MIDSKNKYSTMQKSFYTEETTRMAKGNHKEHDPNPDYWDILLKHPKHTPDKYINKTALDFGCGCGRNVNNLLQLTDWNRVDGIDISPNNITYCNEFLSSLGYKKENFSFYENNGIDVSPLKTNEYDFIMSTITFQHICVHEIRYSLLKDLYRVLKPGGIFSLQVGYDKKSSKNVKGYYENYYDSTVTNGKCDFAVEKEEYMIEDLKEIGYRVDNYVITNSFSDGSHDQWIYWELSK